MRVLLFPEGRPVLYKITKSSDRKIKLLIFSNINQRLLTVVELCNLAYTQEWFLNNVNVKTFMFI